MKEVTKMNKKESILDTMGEDIPLWSITIGLYLIAIFAQCIHGIRTFFHVKFQPFLLLSSLGVFIMVVGSFNTLGTEHDVSLGIKFLFVGLTIFVIGIIPFSFKLFKLLFSMIPIFLKK
jgi:hypothetical protein